MISTIDANRTFPCSRSTYTRRRSPGTASETKTVFPSAWANPRPPGRIRSISTSKVVISLVLLNEEETEARNRKLLSQTLQQQIIEGLLVSRSVHLRTIGFELILHSIFKFIQRARAGGRKHRIVQHPFETSQRVFEFARVERRSTRKVFLDVSEQSDRARQRLRKIIFLLSRLRELSQRIATTLQMFTDRCK